MGLPLISVRHPTPRIDRADDGRSITLAPHSSGSGGRPPSPPDPPMTPDNAHSLEAPKSTGRARRIALKAAFSLMQMGLGAACVIGTFWGVTRFLAGDFETAGRAPTSPGASATGSASGLLAVATPVRATEMPEIKRGVPELMPVRDQPKLSPTVIRNFAAKAISTTQVEVPVIGSTAAWHDESSSDRRRLHEERVASDASAPGLNSTPIVSEVPPEVPAITTGSFGPSVISSPPQVASTTLDVDSAKEAVSGVNRQDAEAAKGSPAASAEPANEIHASAEGEIAATRRTAPTIMSPNRTDAQGKGVAKKDKRVVQRSQAQAAKDINSSSAREATTRSNAAATRNDKPAIAQRTRVAAAPAEPSTPATPPPAAAEVEEQRVHLLGISLPTGRKVRECLLEWRC